MSRTSRKLSILASLAVRRPGEFCDRVGAFVDVKLDQVLSKRPAYHGEGLEAIPGVLARYFGEPPWDGTLGERELARVEEETGKRLLSLHESAPFPTPHNADFTLARFCYASCRILRPHVVVETGVAYGLSSAFILAALEANGDGTLHSIDLPPLGSDADEFVGILIPSMLKKRWRLHRGASRRILPKLLPELRRVDLFLHDSLHTYQNMMRELSQVTPFLSRPSIAVVDDIQGNGAFLKWAEQARPGFWTAIREQDKQAMFGVAVLV